MISHSLINHARLCAHSCQQNSVALAAAVANAFGCCIAYNVMWRTARTCITRAQREYSHTRNVPQLAQWINDFCFKFSEIKIGVNDMAYCKFQRNQNKNKLLNHAKNFGLNYFSTAFLIWAHFSCLDLIKIHRLESNKKRCHQKWGLCVLYCIFSRLCWINFVTVEKFKTKSLAKFNSTV